MNDKNAGGTNNVKDNTNNMDYKTFGRDLKPSLHPDNRRCTRDRTKEDDGDVICMKSGETPDEPQFTMQEAIDTIGFGPFQILVSCFFGFTLMADSMETMLLTVVSPVLKCVFHLTPVEVGSLVLVVFISMLLCGNAWGKFGDVYGRKMVLFMCVSIVSYFGILSSFSPSFLWVNINRFLAAFGLGGFPQIFTYYSEFLPTRSRSFSIVVLGVVWSFGAMLEVALAMLTLPQFWWRLFLFLSAIPVTIVVCLLWFVPESPRHLLAHGRTEEAYAILQRVAKMNNKRMPDGALHCPLEKEPDSNRISHLFLPQYRRTTILIGIAAAGLNMTYFGTALLTTALFDINDGCHGYKSKAKPTYSTPCSLFCTTLTQNDYLDLLLTAIGDTIGILLCILLMSKLGRRSSIGIQIFLYTVFTAAINICASRNVVVALSFCSRAFTNGAAMGLFVYITEVYPTSIRAKGMGMFVTLKSVGVVITALTHSILLSYSTYLVISSLALFGLITTVAVCLLPHETRDRKMADTLEDAID